MPFSFNRASTIIAIRPLSSVGGRSYEPGDTFPWSKIGGLTERRVGQMMDQGKIAELTQESFDFAMKQRTDGRLPRGFTKDGLEALGIRVSDDAPTAPAPEIKAEAVVEYTSPPTPHRGYTIAGKKTGATTRFDIFGDQGDRLNPGGMLNGMKQVNSFIDNLEAEKARIAAAGNLTDETGAPQTPPAGDLQADLQKPGGVAQEGDDNGYGQGEGNAQEGG